MYHDNLSHVSLLFDRSRWCRAALRGRERTTLMPVATATLLQAAAVMAR
jgi:hypothetical protein